MIGVVLALALIGIPADRATAALGREPVLAIDPCVGAEENTVRRLLELELRDARGPDALLPQAITVGCIDGGQEIRAEPWADLGDEGIRRIQLPGGPAVDAAAREGRSRELALAIAELIRRIRRTHPAPPPEPIAPPPPPPPPVVAPPPAPAAAPIPDRWELGVHAASEHFGAGVWLAGGDAALAAHFGRWLLAELSCGARVGPDRPAADGRLTIRALTASAAVGLEVQSRRRALAIGLLMRARGYRVQFGAEFPPGEQPAARGAWSLAAEPEIEFGVTRHVWIQATGGIGHTIHGVIVRNQDLVVVEGASGILVSASLGVTIRF